MPDAAPTREPPGALVAVVGPSGAGKDTILSMAAAELRNDPRFCFARRTVTRDVDVGAEDHDCLSPAEFEAATRSGAFCLRWEAHGFSYGLPSELQDACRSGRTVVANLSRRALADAAARFKSMHVVEVFAPRDCLVQRIASRGRETSAEIERRLARQVVLDLPAGAAGFHRIDNSGRPESAAAAFVAILRQIAGKGLVL